MALHSYRTILAAICISFSITACAPSQEQGRNTRPRPSYDARDNGEPVRVATVPLSQAPTTTAKSVIVIDAVTGRPLYAKNADEPRAIASTQKLLTALVVCEDGPLDDPVDVQVSDTQVEPTKIYIKPGERYSRGALVKALLVKSGNDVAKALARDVAGSQEAFADMMNQKAQQIGMHNSHFRNPHGLTEPGQISSARDLSRLAMAAWRNRIIRGCTASKSYAFTRPNGKVTVLENTNKVLKKVPYCDGLKTGTTNASGRCLVSSGTFNGRSTIVVVLGATSANIWKESEALLRWSLER